jgi:hypothetical protein
MPLSGESGRSPAGSWCWFILAAAVLAVAGLIWFGFVAVVHKIGPGFKLTPNVAAKDWQPDAGSYCAGLSNFSSLGFVDPPLTAAIEANEAPTRASREAMLAYYHDDVAHRLNSAADLALVVSSYQCPR